MGKLITEQIEDVQFIVEDHQGKKTYCVEGIFIMCDVVNRNNRNYPFPIAQKAVDAYNKDYIMKNRALGELGHPDNPTINLERVSHMITTLRPDGTNFIGKAKILDTPMGNIAKGLLDGGAKLGISTRGVGSLKPSNGCNIVQSDFKLATAGDLVHDPSAHEAFLQSFMENKEWIYENGNWKEAEYEKAKRVIKAARKDDIEFVALKLFENYISKI
jgi:hypothetical protein